MTGRNEEGLTVGTRSRWPCSPDSPTPSLRRRHRCLRRVRCAPAALQSRRTAVWRTLSVPEPRGRSIRRSMRYCRCSSASSPPSGRVWHHHMLIDVIGIRTDWVPCVRKRVWMWQPEWGVTSDLGISEQQRGTIKYAASAWQNPHAYVRLELHMLYFKGILQSVRDPQYLLTYVYHDGCAE